VLSGVALAGSVEPPVTPLIGAGHPMMTSHNRYLEEVGSAAGQRA
jgi:hypothetical protein